MDYATNAAIDLEYYFRPYAGTQAVYRYKLMAQGVDNRMVPIVTTNQSNTTIVEKTPTSVAFRPNMLWLYNTTTTISAGGQFGAQTVTAMGYLSNGCTYNFNTTIAARQMIYLRGTYDRTTGLFTLDTTKNADNQYRDYYKTVPYNTAGITLSNYLDEADYILVGCCYSSANYLQLFMVNTLYHFDGTNLIPYDTWNDNRIEAGSSSGTWGSITGTLSDQTDLWSALGSKLDSTVISSYATQSYVNSSISALNYASAGHNHDGSYLPDGSYYAGALLISPNSYTSGTQQLQSLYTTAVYVSSALWLSPVDSMYSDTSDTDGIHIGTSISGRYLSIDYAFTIVGGSLYANMAYVNGSQVKTAAFYDSTAFASSGHTHDYIPLSGTTSLSGNLVPTVNTVNLGNSNKPFGAVYANNVYGLSLVSAATLNLDGDYIHKMYNHNIVLIANLSTGTGNQGRWAILGLQIFSSDSTAFTTSNNLYAYLSACGFNNSSTALFTGLTGRGSNYNTAVVGMYASTTTNVIYLVQASNSASQSALYQSSFRTIGNMKDKVVPMF